MEFKQSVKEALAYYVYALVDPRDHKIFYIGKGKDKSAKRRFGRLRSPYLRSSCADSSSSRSLATFLPLILFSTIRLRTRL